MQWPAASLHKQLKSPEVALAVIDSVITKVVYKLLTPKSLSTVAPVRYRCPLVALHRVPWRDPVGDCGCCQPGRRSVLCAIHDADSNAMHHALSAAWLHCTAGSQYCELVRRAEAPARLCSAQVSVPDHPDSAELVFGVGNY